MFISPRQARYGILLNGRMLLMLFDHAEFLFNMRVNNMNTYPELSPCLRKYYNYFPLKSTPRRPYVAPWTFLEKTTAYTSVKIENPDQTKETKCTVDCTGKTTTKNKSLRRYTSYAMQCKGLLFHYYGGLA